MRRRAKIRANPVRRDTDRREATGMDIAIARAVARDRAPAPEAVARSIILGRR
jgi:hypothetical protein